MSTRVSTASGTSDWELVVDGIDFGEGPRWHLGRLWFSDFYQGTISSVGHDHQRRVEVEWDGRPSGLGWLPDGRLLFVSMLDRCVMRREADGTIVGYTVRLKPQVEKHRIRAFMTVAVQGNRIDALLVALRGDPAVSGLHTTNGRWDIVAELQADSLEAFDRVLGRIRLGSAPFFNRPPAREVTVHQIVGRGLVGHHVGPHAAGLGAPKQFGNDLCRVAAQRNRNRLPARRVLLDELKRFVQAAL